MVRGRYCGQRLCSFDRGRNCKKVTNHDDSESDIEEDKSTDLDLVSVCNTRVSDSEAMKIFDGCITWLHQQNEAITYNLAILHESRELAATKMLSNLKQMKLNSFLT